MNNGEKIDYMIQCLEMAKEEYNRTAKNLAEKPDYGAKESEWRDYWKNHEIANASLIKDNLRNVARTAFRVANEI
jgi:hypothetical protein